MIRFLIFLLILLDSAISFAISLPFLSLKQSKSLSEETQHNPVSLTAEHLEYAPDDSSYLAEGSVVVLQPPYRITTDWLSWDQKRSRILARGRVRLMEGEDRVEADTMDWNTQSNTGKLLNGKIFVAQDHYLIEGKEIEQTAVNRIRLQDASFTTCNCPDSAGWRIQSNEIYLRLGQYLLTRGTTLYVNRVPVFYLPYFMVPVLTERQTGLLIPQLGYSFRDGMRYRQALFLAISRSQDATFSFDFRGQKGIGTGLEYRYALSPQSGGKIEGNYFYDDKEGLARWDIASTQRVHFSEQLLAKMDFRYVNQPENFLVLSDQIEQRAEQQLVSTLFFTYRGATTYAYLSTRYIENLRLGVNDQTTLQLLPEIGLRLSERPLFHTPFFGAFESSAVYFWRRSGETRERFDLYPSVQWPFQLSKRLQSTASLGVREVGYFQEGGDFTGRTITRFGIDLRGNLYKQFYPMSYQMNTHLVYESINTKELSITPFDDLDRVRSRHALTASITQRFLGKHPMKEATEGLLRFTQSYLFSPPDSLLGQVSDLRMETKIHPAPAFSFESDTFYRWKDQRWTSLNSDMLWRSQSWMTLTIGQRYTRNGQVTQQGDLFNSLYLENREGVPRIHSWNGGIVIHVNAGVSLAGRIYFNNDLHEAVDQHYGIRYTGDCWGITLAYREIPTRNEFSFMIHLKGLGSESAPQYKELFKE